VSNLNTHWSLQRILLRITAVVAAILAISMALVAGILAPYYFSVHVAQVSLLTLTAVVSFGAIVWLGMRLCAALWRSLRPARFASMSAGALTVVFLIALYFLILRPQPLRYTDVIPAENSRYWHLPTGSTIAYQEFLPPANIAVKPEPIIFIHGGPGLRFAPFDTDAYRIYAADGYRVYLYDQAGSGASGRFPHIKEYSIARSVEDLEAIRLQLHVERMILIGHSWGSTLAASYMAKHPDRVSKVVFHSPGPIWNLRDYYPFEYNRTEAGKQSGDFPPFRFIAGLYLMEQNPDAAEDLLSQREAEEMLGPLEAGQANTVICKGDTAMLPPVIAGVKDQTDNPGLNPYVTQRLIDQTTDPREDPRKALKGNNTPAILLVGECNFVPWSAALDYRQAFANLKVFYFPKAAHYIQFEQPELLSKVIRNFLLDQPDAIAPYTGDADPSPLPK
jgi:pimeloyl-ACP methyl ester carboxylesterase